MPSSRSHRTEDIESVEAPPSPITVLALSSVSPLALNDSFYRPPDLLGDFRVLICFQTSRRPCFTVVWVRIAKDIRATEVDKAEVAASLRPGDIIRARVISLGDSTQYFLSTAENELGVRWAKSSAGAIMVPISWQVKGTNRGRNLRFPRAERSKTEQ